MKHTYLPIIALTACLLPSCGEKEDVPPARETTKEEVKDDLDTRDYELVKDIAEEIKGEEEVVELAPPAREDTKEDVKDALDTRDGEVIKDLAEEVAEDAEVIKEAAEDTVEDITGEE